jgi:hypothetical protein
MSGADHDDDLLSDKGTLTDLADLLRRGGGPGKALIGGLGSLGFAAYALAVLDDRNAALGLTLLSLWCFLGAWLISRFASK